MNLNNDDAIDEIATLFSDSESQVLLAEIHIGEDAAEFVKSDVGRYLLGRANQEIKAATNDLKRVYPWRRNRIQQLQNQIKVHELFKSWLVEAIVSGRTALSELDRRREEIE